jgi:hypothetical protein
VAICPTIWPFSRPGPTRREATGFPEHDAVPLVADDQVVIPPYLFGSEGLGETVHGDDFDIITGIGDRIVECLAFLTVVVVVIHAADEKPQRNARPCPVLVVRPACAMASRRSTGFEGRGIHDLGHVAFEGQIEGLFAGDDLDLFDPFDPPVTLVTCVYR